MTKSRQILLKPCRLLAVVGWLHTFVSINFNRSPNHIRLLVAKSRCPMNRFALSDKVVFVPWLCVLSAYFSNSIFRFQYPPLGFSAAKYRVVCQAKTKLVRCWPHDTFVTAKPLFVESRKTDTPSNRILYGSDVLCFIGENPGFETSEPGFFICDWARVFFQKKKRLLGRIPRAVIDFRWQLAVVIFCFFQSSVIWILPS